MVPHARYLFDHGDVPAELASTYACSGLTAYSALDKIKEQAAGRTLVIIGGGGVGFAALRVAQALFDTQLIVTDIDDTKLQAAKEGGAAYVFNVNDEETPKEIKKLTGGGSGAVIDFVGSEASAKFGLKILGNSGALIVVGLFGGALAIDGAQAHHYSRLVPRQLGADGRTDGVGSVRGSTIDSGGATPVGSSATGTGRFAGRTDSGPCRAGAVD